MSLFGVTLQQLIGKVRDANQEFIAGAVRDAGITRTLAAGQTLRGVPDIGLLLLTTRDGRPVYVRDVAKTAVAPSVTDSRVWTLTPGNGDWVRAPAVTVALAKRAGANAVVVSQAILDRVETLKGRLIPNDIAVEVTRDYGRTADDKANELLFHLGLATVSIVVLIAVAVGWREAVVTLVVIPTTILLTMLAARLMGYTINRVSLFALIFSIGILVDDAIVVVENIARHWGMRDGRPRMQAAIAAVAEVGNPTVVATLTVIAALLPMLFVSGLMGPYMAPIPANASSAMLFSFFVAMVVAPWLMLKLAPRAAPATGIAHGEGRLGRIYRAVAEPLLRSRTRAWIFLLGVGFATIAACVMFYTEDVTVKLLPFDNKSELAVVLNLPEGSSLEDTERTLFAAAELAHPLPEIRSIQAYAGTAAPFNFNGLVRHAYMRQSPELGDLQLNLAPKEARDRASHAIALDLRTRLAALKLPGGSTLQVVEVPPGPPVLATLLAEIYGPDAATRRNVAAEVKKIFRSVPFIVDVGDSYGQPRPRLRIAIDQDELEYFGVEQSDVYNTVQALFGGVPVGYSHRGEERDPIEIRIGLPKSGLDWSRRLASTPVPANTLPGSKTVVELGQVVRADREVGSPVLFRRDGHFADMITAELAGSFEAPIYGMLAVNRAIADARLGRAAAAGDQPARAAHRRVETIVAVGRRVGDHLRHFPRHGRRVRRGDPRHLHPGGRAVPQLQAAAGDPDADPAHARGHRDRALAVPCALHRDVDDRLHRPCRHHRAQFDPAGRFRPARRRQRQDLAGDAAGCRRGALQADPAHGAVGDDRRGDDPERPDLSGAGDLAVVRARLVHAADRPGHPGDLRRASRCRRHPGPARRGDAGRHSCSSSGDDTCIRIGRNWLPDFPTRCVLCAPARRT